MCPVHTQCIVAPLPEADPKRDFDARFIRRSISQMGRGVTCLMDCLMDAGCWETLFASNSSRTLASISQRTRASISDWTLASVSERILASVALSLLLRIVVYKLLSCSAAGVH